MIKTNKILYVEIPCLTTHTLFKFLDNRFLYLRGQSDKYLASPPDGVTIAREIYYRVVHSRVQYILLAQLPSTFEISAESDSKFCFDCVWNRTCPRILEKWRKSNIGL